jgi:hypothetical protein
MTEEELQHMKQMVHDLCGVTLRLQIDMQSKTSLRDKFAMAALTGLLGVYRDGMAEAFAIQAYKHADAMLAARDEKHD